jgi:hypothetical protein
MKRSFRSRVRAVLVMGLFGLTGGCSFLADEFSWFDRPAPGALAQPDAAADGTRPGH